MKKALFWVENGEINKNGLDLDESYQEIIAYEMDDKGTRPIKEIGRIKLK